MKVYREYGQNPTAVGFSAIALIELTRADDPQAALAEAAERKEAGEEVTAKVAREIAAGRASMRPRNGLNPTPHKKGEHAAGTGPAATT